MNTNEMNLHRMLAQKDAEIERLKKYADAIHADKMDALLEIERLKERNLSLQQDRTRLVEKIERLRGSLELILSARSRDFGFNFIEGCARSALANTEDK